MARSCRAARKGRFETRLIGIKGSNYVVTLMDFCWHTGSRICCQISNQALASPKQEPSNQSRCQTSLVRLCVTVLALTCSLDDCSIIVAFIVNCTPFGRSQAWCFCSMCSYWTVNLQAIVCWILAVVLVRLWHGLLSLKAQNATIAAALSFVKGAGSAFDRWSWSWQTVDTSTLQCIQSIYCRGEFCLSKRASRYG